VISFKYFLKNSSKSNYYSIDKYIIIINLMRSKLPQHTWRTSKGIDTKRWKDRR